MSMTKIPESLLMMCSVRTEDQLMLYFIKEIRRYNAITGDLYNKHGKVIRTLEFRLKDNNTVTSNSMEFPSINKAWEYYKNELIESFRGE